MGVVHLHKRYWLWARFIYTQTYIGALCVLSEQFNQSLPSTAQSVKWTTFTTHHNWIVTILNCTWFKFIKYTTNIRGAVVDKHMTRTWNLSAVFGKRFFSILSGGSLERATQELLLHTVLTSIFGRLMTVNRWVQLVVVVLLRCVCVWQGDTSHCSRNYLLDFIFRRRKLASCFSIASFDFSARLFYILRFQRWRFGFVFANVTHTIDSSNALESQHWYSPNIHCKFPGSSNLPWKFSAYGFFFSIHSILNIVKCFFSQVLDLRENFRALWNLILVHF